MSTDLAAIFDELGPEGVERILGAWLGRMHHARPRLAHSRPPGPARAPHYLAFVRELPCAVCGAPPPSDPHHYGSRGVAQKTDDYLVAPLCRSCHEHAHHHGPKMAQAVQDAILATLVQYLRIVEQR